MLAAMATMVGAVEVDRELDSGGRRPVVDRRLHGRGRGQKRLELYELVVVGLLFMEKPAAAVVVGVAEAVVLDGFRMDDSREFGAVAEQPDGIWIKGESTA